MIVGEELGEEFASLLWAAAEDLECDRAGVAVRGRAGAAVTLVASDEVVTEADQLQERHADGPAVSPAWPTAQVAVENVARGGPWPVWARALPDLGIRSVLATQIVTAAGATGSLTLYYHRRAHFHPHELAMASVLARHAASELRHAQTMGQLWTAIERRTCLGQAQGILMARFGIAADEAFGALVRQSRDTDTTLSRVAESVVTTGHLESSRGPRP